MNRFLFRRRHGLLHQWLVCCIRRIRKYSYVGYRREKVHIHHSDEERLSTAAAYRGDDGAIERSIRTTSCNCVVRLFSLSPDSGVDPRYRRCAGAQCKQWCIVEQYPVWSSYPRDVLRNTRRRCYLWNHCECEENHSTEERCLHSWWHVFRDHWREEKSRNSFLVRSHDGRVLSHRQIELSCLQRYRLDGADSKTTSSARINWHGERHCDEFER